jgi:Zn finger protein HypA/HybF involved in hydrogenase expression
MRCFTYKTDTFKCKECNWTGVGTELSYGDLSIVQSVFDMYCPKCHAYIVSWLAPTLYEVRKWKAENENKATDWDKCL